MPKNVTLVDGLLVHCDSPVELIPRLSQPPSGIPSNVLASLAASERKSGLAFIGWGGALLIPGIIVAFFLPAVLVVFLPAAFGTMAYGLWKYLRASVPNPPTAAKDAATKFIDAISKQYGFLFAHSQTHLAYALLHSELMHSISLEDFEASWKDHVIATSKMASKGAYSSNVEFDIAIDYTNVEVTPGTAETVPTVTMVRLTVKVGAKESAGSGTRYLPLLFVAYELEVIQHGQCWYVISPLSSRTQTAKVGVPTHWIQ